MEDLLKSREFLQQQIATTEAQLSQLNAALERTEQQIAAGRPTTATTTTNKPETVNKGEVPSEQNRRYPLEQDEYRRYGRQMIVDQIGLDGQLKLRESSVLIVGAGGLGCPAAMYLAGAGVGTIGIIDGDTVEESNLHRQVLHRTRNVGKFKVDSAIRYLKELNPYPKYIPYRVNLTPAHAPSIFSPYDLILDCTDNPATRYLISDTAVVLGKPLVSASALRTEGQLMVLNYPPQKPVDQLSALPTETTTGGPCYRCVFPKPPPAASVTSCADGGILGPVVGVMGVLQALEAIRVLTQTTSATSTTMSPTLHLFSAFSSPPFRSIRLRQRRQDCAACSPTARTITLDSLRSGSMDYVQFCGGVVGAQALLGAEERISAREYWRRYQERWGEEGEGESPILIDVREAVQYGLGALKGSVNIPISSILSSSSSSTSATQLNSGSLVETAPNGTSAVASTIALNLPSWYPSSLLDTDPTRPIHVVCRLGNDSQVAVRKLKELGVDRGGERWVGDIRGGLKAWREEVEPEFPDY
ncbi:molybdenum cofactor biosynthetic protein [Histoplasma capsulatum G186AR]|uniref:Adenylyltransferase and sulfurtransferase uba4 n=2 Tax=Ajellomyces capsulatus TaxID=5037 RepID=C0NQD0_AJECG|nr:molybdenum cofactor biosynthetic protein [Histoplasma capsulatum G186AR]EEH06402.1 molybdenum cofactor biosynthetic protein [Histoplasma capsulatum G186AR]KAG5293138.1 molybdenum cofactor biosynthetic protein [Histoplasma capsulatum]QSS74589.1 molybdenum cofactor biosynthetic protein [Histoplasma capsulatum G186AR]